MNNTSQAYLTFLLVVIAVVVSASLLEAFFLSRKQQYDWKAMGVSLFDLVGRRLMMLVPVSLATPVFAYAWAHRLTTINLSSWQAVLLLFIGQEFCYYWLHRADHRIRWFWANHAVHHSPNELNLSAAFRLGIFGRLTGSTLFFTPLVWLGFSPQIVLTTLSINLLYQFWIHATWIPKLGWLEYVLNTPSAHRVHHASNLEYLDANYGGVLIIFDRLFGTYIEEREDVPCRYGLVHPVTTYNPLKIELGQWIGMWNDVKSARSVKAALGYILMPPGWRPDGEGGTTEDLRRKANYMPQRVAHLPEISA
jgi:sterol desaturase/sphingolipid hydroxylase (fatty acid hydroxylase superfamily)